jgi:hypothetical protein
MLPKAIPLAMRKHLTDRALKALRPADAGSRYEVMDSDVRGLGLRVSDKGKRTFILIARYPGSKNPVRRALGEYPMMELAEARKKARRWCQLISEGRDPKPVERESAEQQRREELRKRKDTFEAVAEDYIQRRLKNQRQAKDAERTIRRELITRWGHRPIGDIGMEDVIEVVEEIMGRDAPHMARNTFGHIRALFGWALTGPYGLDKSPTDRLKPGELIGKKESRERVLDDGELAALWRVTGQIGYPFGPLYRLLLLTGARKNEWGEATRSEVDPGHGLLTIPPERFESKATHRIPLVKEATNILGELPRFNGDYLFSTSFGTSPVSGFAKSKLRIDTLMKAELGYNPKPWVTHDIRRTVRTRLASLRVSDIIAEMIIGHGRRGLQRVYDQHTYESEMREALELWAERLRDIVSAI